MGTLAAIRRHPIKGIGHEVLEAAELSPKGALHGDRAWALLTARAADVDHWQPRINFLCVAAGPGLAPIGATTEADGRVSLTHPERDPLTFDPGTEAEAFRDWIGDLWPESRPAPARLVKAPGHGMTDIPDPFVSIGSLSSLAALSDLAETPVDMRRFRLNLWVDGWGPWAETDMIGERLEIGSVKLEVIEPVERCRAPDANPETGARDITMLPLLERTRKTRNFGIYAKVLNAGTVTLGDKVTT